MYGSALEGLLDSKSSQDHNALLEPSLALHGRYVHLDATRICCIACVVLNQFDERLGLWNALYAQNWVLQLLWVVCGICFSLSRKTIGEYVCRMSLYFSIGVVANWSAWLLQGWDWAADVWTMLQQMVFVLILMVIAVVLAPLRGYLRRVARDATARSSLLPSPRAQAGPEDPFSIGADGGGGTDMERNQFLWSCLVMGTGLFGLPLVFSLAIRPVLRELEPFIDSKHDIVGLPGVVDAVSRGEYYVEASFSIQTCLSALWIVYVWPKLFKDRTLTLVAWALIVNLYVYRLIAGYGSSDLPFHGFSLFLLAMTAHELGMAGRQLLGRLVVRYWMVVVFTCAFLWTPGMHGDLTNRPPLGDLYHRERFILIEGVMLVAWLTGGQYMFDAKIFTVDKLTWVNEWALVIFLVHQSVKWLFPWRVAWAFLLCLGPVFWLCQRVWQKDVTL